MDLNTLRAVRDDETNTATERLLAAQVLMTANMDKNLDKIASRIGWIQFLMLFGGAALLFVSFIGALS